MAIKYKWLAAKLREQLPDYAARGQHQLPTEVELASRYKVSRQTVRQALAQLTQEGLIEKRQGSGSFLTGRLRSFDQNIVSILISSDSDYTYPTFLYHLRHELQRKNFMLRVHITGNDIAKERSIRNFFLTRHEYSLSNRSKVHFPIPIWICTAHCSGINVILFFSATATLS